ncbi:L-type lectin-domain containing receptor kinase IX.1 [Gossypium raimondii]|nr:L-type lectin-domain containing receptor kinase IX.1 [Gossypium raimondii]
MLSDCNISPCFSISMAIGFINLLQSSLLIPFLFTLPFVTSLNFQISRFDSNASNILYQGDAKPSVGAIEFNLINYINRVGRATYAEKVPIWDSRTGRLTDFSTRFSFNISIQGSDYGHGLVFFLAPVGSQIPLNSAGGFLGLFNTTTSDSSQNQIVLVEFDTFENPEWDPTGIGSHVGINENSISSANYTRWNASFHSGDTADVVINYNDTTKNLSVSWSYQKTNNPRENSSLSYQIDLMTVLPEWVMVGFSAATGQYVERHTLQYWEFGSSLTVAEDTSGNKARNVRIVVSIVVPVGVLIAGTIIAFIIWKRKKHAKRTPETTNLTSMNDDLERGAGPRRFSYTDLASATNNFSEQRKLGEGGFGAVYRGYLNDLEVEIAVKRISSGSKQGRKEYVTEVKVISQLRHRNLVQLIGWCHDKNDFILVYEFMPNGSLDSHLFGRRSPLTWSVRYRISLGLASALLYLHEEWEQCVVHRDIKSSNVMLDSSFNVKLGDFGLAKLMDHEQGPKTTGLAGTIGYLAPEYICTGRASKESDVYSFGVVLLEIATGRKSVGPGRKSDMGLVEWIWGLYGTGELILAVDDKLGKEFDEKQVESLMIVGLWCAHPDYNSRPSIRQAIHVLCLESPLPNLPVKMPVPTYQVSLSSVSSSEPSVTYSSMDLGR